MPHKILVAQGGGPTAVINQSLAGVALEARRFPEVSACLRRAAGRARHRQRRSRRFGPGDGRQLRGGRGDAGRRARLDPRQARPQILPGDFQGPEGSRDRHLLLHRRQRFVRHRAHRREDARPSDYGLRSIHIPKTIDNDLVGFDHTPGFPSAARFVAQAFAGANLDNVALPGVYVAVVMGRHARLPHRGRRAGAQFSRRRAASGLSARAHVVVDGFLRTSGRRSRATAGASSRSPKAFTTTRARRSS